MTDFADPSSVHETLAILLVIALFVAAVLAMVYIRVLGRFFEELKANEPDVWTRVGSPGLLDMVALPFVRFHKYYAFVPLLRQRATMRREAYRYAAPAYRLLVAGLLMALILFSLVILTVFWIVSHGL